MSEKQQKQPPKRATSGIFAILMALLLLILGQQGILPLGDTADAPDSLPTATIAAALTHSPTSAPTQAPQQTAITAPQDIADYIFAHGTLPDNFLTKNEARQLGWDSSQNYVSDVAPGVTSSATTRGCCRMHPGASGTKRTRTTRPGRAAQSESSTRRTGWCTTRATTTRRLRKCTRRENKRE